MTIGSILRLVDYLMFLNCYERFLKFFWRKFGFFWASLNLCFFHFYNINTIQECRNCVEMCVLKLCLKCVFWNCAWNAAPGMYVLKLHLKCVCWNCTWNVSVETVPKNLCVQTINLKSTQTQHQFKQNKIHKKPQANATISWPSSSEHSFSFS